MSKCRRLLPYLDPFVDGELSPEKTLEVEQQLVDCPACQERIRLQQAIGSSLRRWSTACSTIPGRARRKSRG